MSSPPTGVAAEMITFADESPASVLSLDAPSGLDSTTGEAHQPSVRADATLILALPKIELKTGAARAQVGELYLSDVGIPESLYRAKSLQIVVPRLFDEGDVVRVW